MAKDPSPLLGYNNNIRHKNRVFHIQTEDSGVRHPHIITHLFMDGGRILKSVKTSYAEHLGVEKMADLVRKMMKDQHKGMLIALRDGQFDGVIDGTELAKPAKASPPTGASSTAPAVRAPASTAAPGAPDPSPADAVQVAAPPPPSQKDGRREGTVAPPLKPPPPLPARPVASGPTSERSERVEVVEPSAPKSEDLAPAFEAALDLPPPPANLFRPRTGGNYSTVVSTPPPPESRPSYQGGSAGAGSARPANRSPSARPANAPAPGGTGRPGFVPGITSSRPLRRSSAPPPPLPSSPAVSSSVAPRRPLGAPVTVASKPSASRYASARPAAIFGQTKPHGGSSIFGEDIISDKSLDEVIMSYLADDLGTGDGPSRSSPDPKRRK